jgi:Spy/CpxP family protein refolding chaperone
MKTFMAIRLNLAIATLMTFAAAASAQAPVPWDGNKSFWNNPETAKSLNLTQKQQNKMNNLLNKANEQFLLEIRSKFTPEQWKQIQSLRTNYSQAAAELGLKGPDASESRPL